MRSLVLSEASFRRSADRPQRGVQVGLAIPCHLMAFGAIKLCVLNAIESRCR